MDESPAAPATTNRCISPTLQGYNRGSLKLDMKLKDGKMVLEEIIYSDAPVERLPIISADNRNLDPKTFDSYREEYRKLNPSIQRANELRDKCTKMGEIRSKMNATHGWPSHCKNSIPVSGYDEYAFNEIFLLCKFFDWTENTFVKRSTSTKPLTSEKCLAGMVMSHFLQQYCGWANFGVCRHRLTSRTGLPSSRALKFDARHDTLVIMKPGRDPACPVALAWFNYFRSFNPDHDMCGRLQAIVKSNIVIYTRAKFLMHFHNITDTDILQKMRPKRPHVLQTDCDLTKIRITRGGIVTNFLQEAESDIEQLHKTEGKAKRAFLVNQLHSNSKIYENPVEGNSYPRKRESFSFFHPQNDTFVHTVNRHFSAVCRYLLHHDQQQGGDYKRWHHLFQMSPTFCTSNVQYVEKYNNLNVEKVELIPTPMLVYSDVYELCACVPTLAKYDVHSGINFDASCIGSSIFVGKNVLSHAYMTPVNFSDSKTNLFNDSDVQQFLQASLRRPNFYRPKPVPNTTDRYCSFNLSNYQDCTEMLQQVGGNSFVRSNPHIAPFSQPVIVPTEVHEIYENHVTNTLTSDNTEPAKSFLYDENGDSFVYDSFEISNYYDDAQSINDCSSSTNIPVPNSESMSRIFRGEYLGCQYDGSRSFAATRELYNVMSDTDIGKITWSPMFNYSSLIHGSGAFNGGNCYNKNHQSTYWHNLFRGTLEAWGIPSFQGLVQTDMGFESCFTRDLPITHFMPNFARYRRGVVMTDTKIPKLPLNLGNTFMQNRCLNLLTQTRYHKSNFVDTLIGTLYDMYSTSHLQEGSKPNQGVNRANCNPDRSPCQYFSGLVKDTNRNTPDLTELREHVLGFKLDSNIFPIYVEKSMEVRQSIMSLLACILVCSCFNWRIRKRDLDVNGFINPFHTVCNALYDYNYPIWFQMCQSTIVSDLQCKNPFYTVDFDDVVDTLNDQLKLVSYFETFSPFLTPISYFLVKKYF